MKKKMINQVTTLSFFQSGYIRAFVVTIDVSSRPIENYWCIQYYFCGIIPCIVLNEIYDNIKAYECVKQLQF